MPIVTIKQLPRDVTRKRRAAEAVTAALAAAYDCPPDLIKIFFAEYPPDSVAFGGELRSDAP
ncbi:phenylpyruvate tautomerase PptA (4-oxalocrotonate tautomerase family) [Actinocorallia herbida]|uniref:Phenylpyruvate tautomerase PptA (4-oxalocrotonate tautomerase family) n=1 Tax=Actinocorallia herbida TaxID=58109 RepID=A0A3N1D600_9ACTN|nr:tautomerase family protein [Actinocorallia herbida]ROO88963.1 phenylpyruvate tautomerase PptA (4-oxalocrotonate tautomerase family) [Actinocorallia herbida]